MCLDSLKYKMKKLFFLNRIIIACGGENMDALYALEDEIQELEQVYMELAEKLEECI